MTAEDSEAKKTRIIDSDDAARISGASGDDGQNVPTTDGKTTAVFDMSETQQYSMGVTAEYDPERYDVSETMYIQSGLSAAETPEPEEDGTSDSSGDAEPDAPSADTENDEDGDTGEDSDETQDSGGEESGEEASEGQNGEESDEDGEDQPESEKEPDPEAAEIEAIKKKIRERKREKRRKALRRKYRFWTILTLLVLLTAAFIFSLSGFFTVDSIEVEGNSHFSDEEIINIAHAVPGHNLIYNPDKTNIVKYLEQNPYIKSAEVKRKLPSTLVIVVDERKQACAFRYDDDYLVMDDEGILLKKTRTAPKITMVSGLVVSRIRLGETIGTENQYLFSKLLKLIRSMKSADLYFVSIDMTSYQDDHTVRAYIYDKLVVKADYDILVENLDNGRLHKIVEKLFEDGVQRGTISITDDGSASFEPGI